MSALPSARVLRRALGVVADLPPAALAELIEALVNKLDAIEPDPEAEPDQDAACDCGDDDPVRPIPHLGVRGSFGPGDPDDAEENGDAEPDHDAEPDGIGFPLGVLGTENWTGAGL